MKWPSIQSRHSSFTANRWLPSCISDGAGSSSDLFLVITTLTRPIWISQGCFRRKSTRKWRLGALLSSLLDVLICSWLDQCKLENNQRVICNFKYERIFSSAFSLSLSEEGVKRRTAYVTTFFASSLCVFSLYRANTVHSTRYRLLLSSSNRWWRMNTKQANNILRRLVQIYTCRYLSCS